MAESLNEGVLPHVKSRRVVLEMTVVCLVGCIGFLLNANFADLDLFGKMAVGALWEANNGQFPKIDPFNYVAPGVPWVDHEWGSGMIFYYLLTRFGSPAIFWLKCVLVVSIIVLSITVYFHYSRKALVEKYWHLSDYWMVLWMPLIVFTFIPYAGYTMRCHLWSFFFLSIFILILEHAQISAKSRWIWVLPLLSFFWVNLHGGFILGWGTFFLYGLDAVWRAFKAKQPVLPVIQQYGIPFLACVSTFLMTPYGIDFVIKMLPSWTMPRPFITEWHAFWDQKNDFIKQIFFPVLFLFWAPAAVMTLFNWFKSKMETLPIQAGLMLLGGVKGLLAIKIFPLFLVTSLMYGTVQYSSAFWDAVQRLSKKVPQIVRNLWPRTWVFCSAIFSITLMFWTFQQETVHQPWVVKLEGLPVKNSLEEKKYLDKTSPSHKKFRYPVGLSQFIENHHIRGNLWGPFAWGQYFMWRYYPNIRISSDGRYEAVYPHQVSEDTFRFYMDPYRIEILPDQYKNTDYIVVWNIDPKLNDKIIKVLRWPKLYQDGIATLYENPNIPHHAEKHAVSHTALHPEKAIFPPLENPTIALDDVVGDLSRFRLLNN
jgi:hypothetical protein